jgi:cysteinyl-tRNA synthetase
MHNGFLQVEGEKMSKSLGNFFTINELLNDWYGAVLRFQMLMTHYRSPIDWQIAKSAEIEDELGAWVSVLLETEAESQAYSRATRHEAPTPSADLMASLADDLNTSAAITVLRSGYRKARIGGDHEKNQFLMDCEFMGILRHDKLWALAPGTLGRNLGARQLAHEAARKLRRAVANDLPKLQELALLELRNDGIGAEISKDGFVQLIPLSEETKNFQVRITELVEARAEARARKDFKESDRIRDELAAMGVVLKDGKDADGKPVTTWEIAR